tara:strand:- start:59778 stop:60461 length:684 start_codon:yes stop_codon:yes gene_type:complete
MAKIAELTYSVREGIKEFSDDTEFDPRYIMFLYNLKRVKYLRQDLNNYQKSIDNSVQQSFCIGLEEVNANDCGIDINCNTILRSVKKLPKAIDTHTKPAINRVKPSDKLSLPFNFISKERMVYLNDSPFSKAVYSFLDPDGYIYVISKSDVRMLDCLHITGIFENPMELQNFSNCCNCDSPSVCFDDDTTEYPLQLHYIDLIKNEIIKELLVTKQIPEDKENNATDS